MDIIIKQFYCVYPCPFSRLYVISVGMRRCLTWRLFTSRRTRTRDCMWLRVCCVSWPKRDIPAAGAGWFLLVVEPGVKQASRHQNKIAYQGKYSPPVSSTLPLTCQLPLLPFAFMQNRAESFYFSRTINLVVYWLFFCRTCSINFLPIFHL